jgi:hypothetical protein
MTSPLAGGASVSVFLLQPGVRSPTAAANNNPPPCRQLRVFIGFMFAYATIAHGEWTRVAQSWIFLIINVRLARQIPAEAAAINSAKLNNKYN